jgi:ligand-binding sensor domain-containing protein
VDGQLYAADKIKGLSVSSGTNNGSRSVPRYGGIACHRVPALYKKDSLLITTLKNGLYVVGGAGVTSSGAGLTGPGPATSGLVRKPTAATDPLLMNDLINRALKQSDEDRFAMGTATGGVLILDRQGRLIQRLSSAEGLQNNKISKASCPTRTANLWLGLDNGIAFIHYNTSVKLIRPVKDNQLLSNVVKVFDQKLFIGTSNGLYSIPLDASIPDISQLKGTCLP